MTFSKSIRRLGSTTDLTDSETPKRLRAGTPRAAIRSGSGSGGTESEFRFTGEQRDPQVQRNFYFLRARYYDPAIGRFLIPVAHLFPWPRSRTASLPAGHVPPSLPATLAADPWLDMRQSGLSTSQR